MGKNDNFHLHYAVKANANPKILKIISEAGFGADCVSGGEIKAALEAGFPADPRLCMQELVKVTGKSTLA